jgi:protein-disulfide isomerase
MKMIRLYGCGDSIVQLNVVFKEGLLPRFILGIAVSLILFTATSTFAGKVSLSEAMAEKSIGSPNAPITMIEYSSLTCSHCAAFHTDTLPRIKKDYIDTGKVRMVFWDFPLGNLALAATMIARCSGQNNYVPIASALFLSQETWARSDAPFDAIAGVARLSGMSVDDIENCLDDRELLAAIKAKAKEAESLLGVESTPTFFIEGQMVSGNLPYEKFKDLLDMALAKKQ